MAVFTYTAQRSLVGSTVAGDPVNYTLRLTSKTPRKQVMRKEITALGGGKDTLVYHRLRFWDCSTGTLTEEALNELMQFLDSCDNGAGFDMDGAPSTLEGDYSVSQISSKPLYKASFTVRQIL